MIMYITSENKKLLNQLKSDLVFNLFSITFNSILIILIKTSQMSTCF